MATLRTTHNLTCLSVLFSLAAATTLVAQPPSPAQLLEKLKQRTAAPRAAAAALLENVDLDGPKDQVIAAMLKMLSSGDSQAKSRAALVLGQVAEGNVEVAKQLIKAAFEGDATVRQAAIKALVAIKAPRELTLPVWVKMLEGTDNDAIMEVIHSMADLGPAVVPALKDALKHPAAAYWACLVASELGTDASPCTPELVDLIDHAQPEVQLQAIVALGQVAGEASMVVPALANVLKSDSQLSSKYAACFALSQYEGSEAALAAVKSAFGQASDLELKLLSAWSMLTLDPEVANRDDAISAIISGLSADRSHIRRLAVRAMTDVKPSKAGPSQAIVAAMKQALKDSDPGVIAQVMDGLAAKGKDSLVVISVGLKDAELRQYAVELARRLGPDAAPVVPALVQTLREYGSDEQLAREIHFALGSIGDGAEACMDLLKQGLGSDNNDVRYSACFALGRMGKAAAVATPELTKAMEQEDDAFMRLSALWSLLQISPDNEELAKKAVPLLIEALSSDNDFIRAEAARTLGGLSKNATPAVAALKKLSSDKSKIVRSAVAEALGKIQ